MQMPDWYRKPTEQEIEEGLALIETDARKLRQYHEFEITPIDAKMMQRYGDEVPDFHQAIARSRQAKKAAAEMLGINYEARVLDPAAWDELLAQMSEKEIARQKVSYQSKL